MKKINNNRVHSVNKLCSLIVAFVIVTTSNTLVCNAETTYFDAQGITGYKVIYRSVSTRKLKAQSQLDGVKLLSTTAQDLSNSSTGIIDLSGGATAEMYKQIDLSQDQLVYLANTVQHEIGNHPDIDRNSGDPADTPMSNIVSVILNRVISDSNDFKNTNTVYDVVSAPNQFSGISPYLNLSVNGYGVYAKDAVYDAIKYVLEHGDTTGGCLFFHSGQKPSWFNSPTIKFSFEDKAGHKFYKLS